jgi:hypothetical protein
MTDNLAHAIEVAVENDDFAGASALLEAAKNKPLVFEANEVLTQEILDALNRY